MHGDVIVVGDRKAIDNNAPQKLRCDNVLVHKKCLIRNCTEHIISVFQHLFINQPLSHLVEFNTGKIVQTMRNDVHVSLQQLV